MLPLRCVVYLIIDRKRDKTWAEFLTLDVGVNVYAMQYTLNNKTG
jgi:hypothetical protein